MPAQAKKVISRRSKQQQRQAVTYLIKDIPVDTWAAVQIRAIRDHMPIKDVVQELLKRYAKRGLD